MIFLLFFVVTLALLYIGTDKRVAASLLALAALLGIYLDGWIVSSFLTGGLLLVTAYALIFANPLRNRFLSAPLLSLIQARLPTLSETESEALKSGNVDWDGELFSGQPDWDKLLNAAPASLSPEELAFINGPVEQLCSMIDDWKITQEDFDLPEAVWAFIRSNGFFGLTIPSDKGGKGFSHAAHSEIVMKISTRSVSAAVTVMVPNSLGPGELLMEYGTDQQKKFYLPRLAKGEEIPCFALTSPVAGSDAGAIPDTGIICQGKWQGKDVLGLKVTWNKRYITLAPVATLIGLAIKVYDPEKILGDKTNIGVTCVLIPRDTEGVNAGARHLPMNTVFMNGPTWGKDVFIPMDQVIGGQSMLGKGWTMLLECLSIGRSISLPALGAGAGKFACLATGSYALTREQFGRSISQFEGVQEALEPMAGYTYMMNAARLLTAGMLDRGIRPAVPSAILKYRNTDLMKKVINYAMDVTAGRGVITGPRNFLANAYQAIPIAITVEGANILTRSLMIFGQGAVRCHPFIADEIEAAGLEDRRAAIKKFDAVLYRHLAHTSKNLLRTFALGLTNGLLSSGNKKGSIRKYYRQLNRFSAAFALITDVTLLSIGGGLKARQRLSGRMADCLTHLYYASAVIKFWHDEDYADEQRPLLEWCLQTCLSDLQSSFHMIALNFPVKALRRPMKALVFPMGATGLDGPNDSLATQVAMSIINDSPVRDCITQGCYVNPKPDDVLGRVLHAYRLANETKDMRERLHKALSKHTPNEFDPTSLFMGHEHKLLVDWAQKQKIITVAESEKLLEALTAIYDALRVDAFDQDQLQKIASCSAGKRKVVERQADK
ncbi:acyl-CoA dehydrogenase [Simiduia litorea]|uniref:acyl-CoA dehydrogenase n=1 Tax=Simiduia litorea TaxID=1435348 RepID=UPI0036F22BEA